MKLKIKNQIITENFISITESEKRELLKQDHYSFQESVQQIFL